MIHNFPTLYIMGGWGLLTSCFVVTHQNYRTSEWSWTANFKSDTPFEILIFPLKSMGKNHQNDLWTRLVASKWSKHRPPILFLGADTKNGQLLEMLMLQLMYWVLPFETSRPDNSHIVLVLHQLLPVRPEERRAG